MSAILEIRDLNKSFGGVNATSHVQLDVEQGEIHAIIGPNGAGKTTLIAQLSGELAPDSGEIRFEGRDITNTPMHTRAHMGLARTYQITSVFQDMTLLENVMLAVQAHHGHSFRFWRPTQNDASLTEPAEAALARVGLIDKARHPAHAVSHGEHRQLEIAMALATDPSLLLLDEPMAGMGQEETRGLVEILKGLKVEKTILLIEHDMDAVFALADRISVLVYGQIIATGAPDNIRDNEDVKRAYLGEEAA
ncbi:MAG: ABC transporter ATP-binding protein [Alphaproteobacteria bacterium]|nr:ABC transporter ATP-binding protein [Alphaproteobacteria bacterium]